MGATVEELARATPASRDRYMDFLRAGSILVVVIGHWMIGVVYWRGGVIGSSNSIGMTPWLWLATWFLQVMPIFFFVGGFSNIITLRSYRRRGESTWSFLRTRMERLLRPSLIFIGVWAVIQVILHLGDVGSKTTPFLRGMRPPGATIPFGPLWFLAVYAAFILMSPVMIWLHERYGVTALVSIAVGSVVVDAVAFVGGVYGVRWVNAVLVFLLPHQIGFFYADGRLTRVSRRAMALMAAGGLAALILLTNPVFGEAGDGWFPGIGHYPKSLLGTGAEPISNAYPPTVCLAAMAFWSIGLAMLARERLDRWLHKPRPWKAVITVNSMIMTLFLWHMTAFLMAVLVLWPLGFGQQGSPTLGWWAERPLWVAVSAVFLFGLVALFGPLERPRRKAGGPRTPVPSSP